MADGRYADEWLIYSYRVMELGYPAPDPVNHAIGLLRAGLTISDRATLADLVAGEVVYSTTYSRVIQGRLITSVDTAADRLTVVGHGLPDNTPVAYASSSTLASPLLEGVQYFTRNSTTDTFQLSLTSGGTAIDLTGAGAGNQIIKLQPVYDAGANKRANAETDQSRISATGGDVTFQGYFIVASPTAGTLVPFATVQSISGSTFTTTATHGWTTGQEIMVVPDPGGTQPGGTAATTIYFARVLTTTTVSLHPTSTDATNNTNVITPSSAGAGTIRLKNARGILKGWEYFGSSQSLTSGSNYLQLFRSRIANIPSPTGV